MTADSEAIVTQITTRYNQVLHRASNLEADDLQQRKTTLGTTLIRLAEIEAKIHQNWTREDCKIVVWSVESQFLFSH